MGVPQQKLFCSTKSFAAHLNDENHNFMLPELSMNNISKFYDKSNIFITGATGFVGKALVEKLLRSCDVNAILLLMRPKRGVPVEQRLKELLKNPVFNKIRDKDPDFFEKVKVIPGDVGMPNLGLSDDDRQFLVDNVNIVFHSAATVKFNEDLKTAVTLNTIGTKQILEVCQDMRYLKSCVHVSTAFSNSDKKFIEEQVYKPTYDAHTIIKMIENLPEDILQQIAPKLVENHPNTYTFAKALAEQLVLEHSNSIPTAIVRPSIITAAWNEPYPGWVDNISGITGITMECARGTIKSIICDGERRMDLIPVDIVVNVLITSAWHTLAYRSSNMRVYNCTSGTVNPVSWNQFAEYTHKHSRVCPSKYVTWYPGFTYRTNRIMHSICSLMYHYIPSMLLDFMLCCIGKKPMMLNISKRFNQALEAGSFFSTNEWSFGSSNYNNLIACVDYAEDGELFNVDFSLCSGFNWDQYVCNFVKGIREYVLKDDISSLPQALTKMNRLYWFTRIFQASMLFVVLKVCTYYFHTDK